MAPTNFVSEVVNETTAILDLYEQIQARAAALTQKWDSLLSQGYMVLDEAAVEGRNFGLSNFNDARTGLGNVQTMMAGNYVTLVRITV
jgi:CRISPR/Cas system-associated exonuclease Cas4 (RecB family)